MLSAAARRISGNRCVYVRRSDGAERCERSTLRTPWLSTRPYRCWWLIGQVRGPQPMVPLEFVSLQARCSVSLGGLHVHDWLLWPGLPAQLLAAAVAGPFAPDHGTGFCADDRAHCLRDPIGPPRCRPLRPTCADRRRPIPDCCGPVSPCGRGGPASSGAASGIC